MIESIIRFIDSKMWKFNAGHFERFKIKGVCQIQLVKILRIVKNMFGLSVFLKQQATDFRFGIWSIYDDL